jgi:hypothetical protein
MPVTLAQASLATQDDIQAGVIDEIRESSYLLDALTFDDAVTPGTIEPTLTYGYTRVKTPATAAFRAVNTEYVPGEAEVSRHTVDCKIFGGAYEVDRVLAGIGGLIDNVQFQQSQKIKAARGLFHDAVINGDTALIPDAFDGLDKALAGSSTEFGVGDFIDLSTSAAIDAAYKTVCDQLDLFLSLLDETPTLLGMNNWLKNRLAACARRAGYLTASEDAFGRQVDTYRGIPLIDLGNKPGLATPVVPIVARDPDGAGGPIPVTAGITDLYAMRLGLDGLHGVTIANGEFVHSILPDFSTAGAVKKGEVEIVAAMALRATKAAGVFRNFKVQ